MEFTRRNLTAAAGATAATTFTRTALGGWEPSERYPDPAIQTLDPSFGKYRLALAGVERLVTGMRWCEGPVYFGDARCLLWSDIPNNRIMRWDDKTGRAAVATGDINRPNGLAFSPDESKLYIVEAGAAPRVIKVFDVVDNGTKLANARPFINAEPGGTPDGFRCDVDGNLWCGWGMGNAQQDGVKIFDPTGKPIGFIALPERCANVCFGTAKRNRLFMAASHSLYSLYVNTQGPPGG